MTTSPDSSGLDVVVCWKWVAFDGPSSNWSGISAADEAALEVGLRLAEATGSVTVLCVGPPEAEQALRTALAVGAAAVQRIDADPQANSTMVAHAIARVAAASDIIVCGDVSLDRATGSVPATVAALLGRARALGLVSLDTTAVPLRAVRRLDGGRREILEVPPPAVLSVEGAVARLRRGSLAATIAATDAVVTTIPSPPASADTPAFSATTESPTITPYRPRPRVVDAPAGSTLERLRDLLGMGDGDGDVSRTETVALDPDEAAVRILEQLTAWGYLPDSLDPGDRAS